MANDYKFPSELYLSKDIYNKPSELDDMLAVAQLFQNLLLIEKGTYPNQPELGVGIENYLFELLDNDTIRDITSIVDNQVQQFIPTEYTIISRISRQKNNKNHNIIFINCTIRNDIKKEQANISYIFGLTNNNSIFSKMVVA